MFGLGRIGQGVVGDPPKARTISRAMRDLTGYSPAGEVGRVNRIQTRILEQDRVRAGTTAATFWNQRVAKEFRKTGTAYLGDDLCRATTPILGRELATAMKRDRVGRIPRGAGGDPVSRATTLALGYVERDHTGRVKKPLRFAGDDYVSAATKAAGPDFQRYGLGLRRQPATFIGDELMKAATTIAGKDWTGRWSQQFGAGMVAASLTDKRLFSDSTRTLLDDHARKAGLSPNWLNGRADALHGASGPSGAFLRSLTGTLGPRVDLRGPARATTIADVFAHRAVGGTIADAFVARREFRSVVREFVTEPSQEAVVLPPPPEVAAVATVPAPVVAEPVDASAMTQVLSALLAQGERREAREVEAYRLHMQAAAVQVAQAAATERREQQTLALTAVGAAAGVVAAVVGVLGVLVAIYGAEAAQDFLAEYYGTARDVLPVVCRLYLL